MHRIQYFDFLRTIAIVAVITIHVTASHVSSLSHSSDFYFSLLLNSLSRWGVPIFIMISGSLLLSKESNKDSIKLLYKKNIIHLTRVFLIWALIYLCWGNIFEYYNGNSLSMQNYFKHGFHLWFLPMLIGLYISSPFLKIIAKDKNTAAYFITICLVFSFLFPNIVKILEIYSSTSKQISLLYNYLSYFNKNLFLNFGGFCCYYILGYYLNFHLKREINKKVLITLGALSIACIYGLTLISNYNKSNFDTYFLGNYNFFTILLSICVFLLAKKIKESKMMTVKNLSSLVIEIYLTHIIVLESLSFCKMQIPYYIQIPLYIIIVFTICIIFSKILHLLGINKYIF